MTKELEERLVMLEKEPNKRSRKLGKLALFIIICLAIGASATVGLVVWRSQQAQTTTIALLGEITAQANFPVYFFRGEMADGFEIDPSSIDYTGDILVFRMVNPDSKKELVFTEQAMGSFDPNSLRADKEFSTSYGQAFITDGQTRTTGTLFTKDETWILVNAAEPIGGDVMKSIIDKLEPAKLQQS